MTRLRILYGVLIVSLAANLVLGGLMLGRALHLGLGDDTRSGWGRGHHAEIDADTPPRWMRRAFGEAGAPVLDDVWQRHWPEMRRARQEVFEQRLRVRDLLARSPFDAVAYREALAEMRRRMMVVHEATHGMMLDAVREAPPEVRDQLAEHAKRWAERRRPPEG